MNPGDIVWSSHFPSSEHRAMAHPALVIRTAGDVSGREMVLAVLGTSRHVPRKDGERRSEFAVRRSDGEPFWQTGLKKDTLFDLERGHRFVILPKYKTEVIGQVTGTLLGRLQKAYFESKTGT